jgi:hypothetical protein
MAAEPNIDYTDQQYWLQLAAEQLTAARAVLRSGKLFLCGMLCYNAIRNALSGTFVKARPFTEVDSIRGLVALAEACTICGSLTDDQLRLLNRLEPFKAAAQSPQEKATMEASLDLSDCTEILAESRALVDWLRQ